MRSLLLASAAIFLTTGAAMAQSTTAPAPTGAPNAPAMTTPGMSPGNAGATTTPMTPPSTSGAMSSSAPSPAPTGAPASPTVTSQGMSPGNTGPNTTPKVASNASGDDSAAVKTTHTYHTYNASMTMPADGSAGQYLHIAKTAIQHHNKMVADEALSRAETRLLDRAVPAGDIASDDSPGVAAIEHARAALNSGNMQEASSDTEMAIHQNHAMMGGMTGPIGNSSN
jgi:hypothetical protein